MCDILAAIVITVPVMMIYAAIDPLVGMQVVKIIDAFERWRTGRDQ